MEVSAAVYYIEANVVCLIVFGILLFHNHFNIDRQEKMIKFDHVLVIFMLYFAVDCMWALIESNLIPRTRFLVVINDFLVYILMAATMYFWLQFVMAYEQVPHRNRRINKFAVLFPFMISTLVMIIHYFIAPGSLINDSLDTLWAYNIYLVAVPYIYMAAIIFYTVRKARSEKQADEKRKHLFIGFFPLMVIAGGGVQFVFPYIPIYCFSAMALMLVFYIQSLELRVSLDPLTQLNNRSQLAHYVSLRSNLSVEGRLTVVIMMDIDGFKSINDSYGHSEGDNALVIVADSLKKAVNSHSMPSFLCRYGGDEFILIIHPVQLQETEQLIQDLRAEAAKASGQTPFTLSVSFGYDVYEDGKESIRDCINNADKKLYLEKERKKNKARQAAG